MKKWYRSRTVWLGVATIIGAGVSAWASGGSWKEGVIAAIGACIILLRGDTSTAIREKKTK